MVKKNERGNAREENIETEERWIQRKNERVKERQKKKNTQKK